MSTENNKRGRGVRGVTIRARLVAAFGALILLLAAMAGVGVWRLTELDHRTAEMANENLRVERVLSEWVAQTRANLLRRLVLTRSDDPALNQLLAPELDAASRRMNDLQKEAERLTRGTGAEPLMQNVSARRSAFLAVRQTVVERKQAGDREGAIALLDTKMVAAQNGYLDAMQALRDYYTAQVERDAVDAAASARSGRAMLAGFCLAGMLVAAIASWLIARSITRPIDEALRAARRVADGDLSITLDDGGSDEMAQLLRGLHDMTMRLRSVLAEVAGGARTVAGASAQIAQGNTDLSQRTEEQASTLEETASSMEELTSTVTQSAENARIASELAAGAAAVAGEGGSAVGQVVRTMDAIAASSRRIAEIIGVIDGIAFQTNILALNAAVEAARAGDQGRGFAVVAGEVRTLAQRSAQAAREIKTLIGDSVTQVEAGTAQVGRAGSKMEDIVQSVRKVSELIAEIAAASREQSSGIEQINVAVTQMDQVVQQNASLVEEAAAATQSMDDEAQRLLQQVGRFRLGTQADLVDAPAPVIAPIRHVTRHVARQVGRQVPQSRPAAPRLASAPQGRWTEF